MRLKLLCAALLALVAAPLSAQAPGEDSAVRAPACDRACLIGFVEGHMRALAARDPSKVRMARDVRYTENNVFLTVGTGLWDTVTGVDATGLEAADPSTGNAAWFGSVKENGQPAIYAVRVHVRNGAIDEIEAVVHRKTALPAPFGDVTKLAHDPEFNQVLPPEQRRPRERMLSIADGYFSTVELNDGQVLTDFTDDCGRLENGISTTAPPPGGGGGNAAAIASGCRNQFLLGLYRINKRVRRDFFIIDEERGVAVARGFFDHANEFDHYKLTDGRDMKTALKWPNSITLLEAFRIRDGKIARIEAVFTYVPYFMPNPFRDPPGQLRRVAYDGRICDIDCLTTQATSVMSAYVDNKWRDLKWADWGVSYAENSVGLRVGEGVWATVTAVDPAPLIVADERTNKAVWIGRIEEHGQPAWAAVTLKSESRSVEGIDVLVRRKEYGAPYAEAVSAPAFPALPATSRTVRAQMLKLVDGFYDALNAHSGKLPAGLEQACQWTVNGQALGSCAAPIAGNSLQWIWRWRDREVLAVDETRGLVAVRVFEDIPSVPRASLRPDGTQAPNPAAYPRTLQIVEVFRIEGGKIAQIRRISTELPYGMKPH